MIGHGSIEAESKKIKKPSKKKSRITTMAESPKSGPETHSIDPKGFNTDPTTKDALDNLLGDARQQVAAEQSGTDAADTKVDHNFGDSWLAFRDTCVHNDDGTYTAPGGTVYDEDGHVVSETQAAEVSAAAIAEPDTEEVTEAHHDKFKAQWTELLRPHIKALGDAITDNKQAYKDAHNGSEQGWNIEDVTLQLAVDLQIGDLPQEEADKYTPQDKRDLRAAVRQVEVEFRDARNQTRARIEALGGDEDTQLKYRTEQANNLLAVQGVQQAVIDARQAFLDGGGTERQWKSNPRHRREVYRQILVQNSITNPIGAKMMPIEDLDLLFRDVNTIAKGGALAYEGGNSTPPKGNSQQSLTEAERKKQERMLEFAAQLRDKDGLLSIKLALGATRDRIADPNNPATQMSVIRDVLGTLNMFGDQSAGKVQNLTDTEILALTQTAIDEADAEAAAEAAKASQTPRLEQQEIEARLKLVENIDSANLIAMTTAVEAHMNAGRLSDAASLARVKLSGAGVFTAQEMSAFSDEELLRYFSSMRANMAGTAGSGSTPRIPFSPGSAPAGQAPGSQGAGSSPGTSGTGTPSGGAVRIPFAPGTAPAGPAPGGQGGPTGSPIGGTSPNTRSQTVEQSTHLDSMLTNVELAKLDELDVARDKWARISSKRQRRSLFGWVVKRSRKFREAKEEYDQLSYEVGRIGLQDKLANASTSLEKNVIAAQYWIAEQDAVREKAAKYTTDRLWWRVANGVSQRLNKGPKTWRVVKRVGIGVLAGVLAAATGGASVAPFIAGLTAFTTGQLKNLTGGIDALTDKQKAMLTSAQVPRIITDEEILASQAGRSEALYNKDSRIQQNKRLRKFFGNAAIGAATGVGFHYGHELLQGAHEHIFGSDTASAAGGPSGTEGGPPDPGAGGHGATPTGPDTPGYGLGDAGPQDVLTPTPSGHELLNSTDAFYVRPGEGWLETFQDMGIPKEHWTDILNDVGPKLHDLGVADFNSAKGEWWISQSGNLKPEVLQTIADSSAKFGYAFKPIA